MKSYVPLVREVAQKRGLDSDVTDVLCNLVDYIEYCDFQGACHSTSSVLYVALRELDYSPRLCIGECRYGDGKPFDHSWVELEGRVFDFACIKRYTDGTPIAPAVVDGIDVVSGEPTDMHYGIFFRGLDMNVWGTCTWPFPFYMDGFPNEEEGLWTVVKFVLKRGFDTDALREKYRDVSRTYIVDAQQMFMSLGMAI